MVSVKRSIALVSLVVFMTLALAGTISLALSAVEAARDDGDARKRHIKTAAWSMVLLASSAVVAAYSRSAARLPGSSSLLSSWRSARAAGPTPSAATAMQTALFA